MKRLCRSFARLLLVSLCGACSAVVPLEVTPPAGMPPHFSLQLNPSVPAPPAWWQVFADSALDSLMDQALSNNLELDQAVARLQQAEALLAITDAARSPAFKASGEALRASQPGMAGRSRGESVSLSLAAAFEVDLWGKLAARSRGAALDVAASREALKGVLLTLSARVADAYYLVVEQRAQQQLAEASIVAYRDSLDMVERRYREGLVPAIDLYQARQNLANAGAAREAVSSTLKTSENALAVLIGAYPGAAIAGQLTVLPAPPQAFPAGLPSALLSHRPDLQSALLRVQAQDARRAAAIAERFPALDLLGSYGRSRSTFSVPTLEGEFWTLVAGVTMPLIDGGRRRAEVDRQQALLDESLAAYRQAVLVAFREVEDALVRNFNGDQRILALQQAEEAAAAALRLALERYRFGLSEYLPVLAAQVFHVQIQGSLLAARRQLLSDRISLARALAGKWLDVALENRLATSP